MDSRGCFLESDGCCTYLEDAVYEDVFIYIVGFLGQFHVNADFFAARKKRFCCYATLNKDKLLLKISFSLYNIKGFAFQFQDQCNKVGTNSI